MSTQSEVFMPLINQSYENSRNGPPRFTVSEIDIIRKFFESFDGTYSERIHLHREDLFLRLCTSKLSAIETVSIRAYFTQRRQCMQYKQEYSIVKSLLDREFDPDTKRQLDDIKSAIDLRERDCDAIARHFGYGNRFNFTF